MERLERLERLSEEFDSVVYALLARSENWAEFDDEERSLVRPSL